VKGLLSRFLLVFGVGVTILLLLMGVFSYTLLPGLIESRLATTLQERYGLEEKPVVEVSSNFPPELLLGRIDRIEIEVGSLTKGGIRLPDVRVGVEDVDVSVLSLLRGDLGREIQVGSLVAEALEEPINEYFR